MTDILMLLSVFILGIVVSVIIAGFKQKALLRIINIPLLLILNSVFFSTIVYIYSKIFSVSPDFKSIFPDTVSKLIGISIYFVVCLITGIILGSIESRGMSRFFLKIYGTHLFKGMAALFLAAHMVLTSICVFLAFSHTEVTLRISEVCPHNFNLAEMSEGVYPDYIELYNSGSSPVMLSDFYLSDDTDYIEKCRLPEVTLHPNEYIIVWADGSGSSIDINNQLHANFKLSDKESIILSDLNNRIIDIIDLGTVKYNVSLTLFENKFIEAYGTPGESNENCIPFNSATLSVPTFSLESGFYTENEITLEIFAPFGSTVYYTTDGSTPTTDSTKYTSAIKLSDISNTPNKYVNIKNTVADYDNHVIDQTPVDKANIIRAIAIDDFGNTSKVVCGTYFVGEVAEKYKNYAVLSVISNPDDLFGDNGICVTGKEYDDWYKNTNRTTAAPTTNFNKHGKSWEREATIQYWDQDGNYILNQNCGIRVQGNSTRNLAKKRLSFYARNIYSNSDTFDAPIFNSDVLTGNFYIRADNYDFMAQAIIEDREVSRLDGIPAVCFIDGEFYNTTFIRERHDPTYFKEHYGVNEEDLVVITEGVVDEGTKKDLENYTELINFITTADVTDPEIYKEITSKLDTQSLIDFMVANIYPSNLDLDMVHNFKMWKSNAQNGLGYNDGKWRCAVYDMDAVAWGSYERAKSSFIDIDTFRYAVTNIEKYGEPPRFINISIFDSLLKNESFKNQFITTFFDMLNTNYSMNSTGGLILEEYGEVESRLWNPLMTTRHSYMIGYLKNAFDIESSESSVTLKTEGNGKIKINTTYALSENGKWEGTYLSGMQISITAEADDGWVFESWKGDITDDASKQTVYLTEKGLNVEAVFVKIGGDD